MKMTWLLPLAMVITGCSTQFPVTARIGHDYQYSGTITPDFTHKNYAVTLDSFEGTTHCYGALSVAVPTDLATQCGNQHGIASFQCDDGNNLAGVWHATNCS